MNDSQLKTLTHANTNEPVIVDMAMVFAHWYSKAHRATVIQSTGGALLPVKEPEDSVTALKRAYLEEKK